MNATTVDTKLMKALAHPLRQQLLMKLSERTASPSELAEELSEPLGNVSYHVRMLVDLDCIELVSTTPRRGALEHHYRATVRPMFDDETYAAIPVPTRRTLIADVLKGIWQNVGDAADAGTFDDEDVHVSRERLTLDEKGREDLAVLLRETLDRALEIKAQSAQRAAKARGGAELTDTWIAMLHFRAAPPSKGRAKPKGKAKPKAKSGSKR